MAFRLIESILVGDDPNTQKWRLWCFSLSHRIVFEQPAAFLPAKKNTVKRSVERNEKNTKSGPCLEISCATIFQPRIPAHLIWCILHTACTLFPGTDLKYNPPPSLRKLPVCVCVRVCVFYIHTLAQKQHCEFCCGVHQTCTKQSLSNCQEK